MTVLSKRFFLLPKLEMGSILLRPKFSIIECFLNFSPCFNIFEYFFVVTFSNVKVDVASIAFEVEIFSIFFVYRLNVNVDESAVSDCDFLCFASKRFRYVEKFYFDVISSTPINSAIKPL